MPPTINLVIAITDDGYTLEFSFLRRELLAEALDDRKLDICVCQTEQLSYAAWIHLMKKQGEQHHDTAAYIILLSFPACYTPGRVTNCAKGSNTLHYHKYMVQHPRQQII
jgi:hypothetical protein